MEKIIRPRHGLAELKLDEVWQYRELIVFLAWRDLLVRYKQTVIGILWALLRPLITMLIFTIVFGHFAKVPSGGIPYPVFALAGLLPWQLFSGIFSEASFSVVGNSQLVSKVYFPRLVIPLSATVIAIVDFLITVVMMMGLMAWYRIPPSVNSWMLIPLTLLCAIAGTGAGIWFAALFVRYRDVRHILPFIVQMGLYISPVGFSTAMVPQRWRLLYSLNPMVGVIDGYRWALFGGSNPIYLPGLAVSILLAIAVLIGGLFYFRNTERAFADII